MIQYVKGDLFTGVHLRSDPVIIAHIVNNKGGWGKGFVVPLATKYPAARDRYREWVKCDEDHFPPFSLGYTQFVKINPVTYVANMCAQDGYRKRYSDPPKQYVSYYYLGKCLDNVADLAEILGASVHMPKIGCGLGGGDWKTIEAMVDSFLCAAGVPVVVYEL